MIEKGSVLVIRQAFKLAIEGVVIGFRGSLQKEIIRHVAKQDRRAFQTLCFKAISYITLRALTISGKRRLFKRGRT